MRKEPEELGISLTTSSPHTLQSNGLAERMNRILLDKKSTMMSPADVREEFWVEPIRHVADLHNPTAPQELKLGTTMEAPLGKVPNNVRLCIHRFPGLPTHT